jgi:hypothetical protein
MSPNRVEALTDGVFATAITLLLRAACGVYYALLIASRAGDSGQSGASIA